MMDPARSYESSYINQMEQQQNSSCLSVREQYVPAVTRMIQPITPKETIPQHVTNSNAYCNYLNMAQPYGTLLHRERARLPYPSVLGPTVPAVTNASSDTAHSAGYSSGTTSRLALSSQVHLPAARPPQASQHPPSRVSNSSH
jgi:hypothetical protein